MEGHDDNIQQDVNIQIKKVSSEHELVSEQSINLLKEIENINKKLQNPKYRTYKKSTYWHQQHGIADEVKQETLQNELLAYVQRIEAFQNEMMASLQRIEGLLIKSETLSKK